MAIVPYGEFWSGYGMVNVLIGLAHSTGDEQEILDLRNYGAGTVARWMMLCR